MDGEKRSRFYVALVLALVLALVAACGGQTATPAVTEEAAPPTQALATEAPPAATEAPVEESEEAALPPFKIGFFGSLTGNFASSGKDLQAGIEMYLEEIGYEAGGRQIVLISEDTTGNPDTALAKARKLVEEDNVDVLIGPNLSSEGYAVRDYIDQAGVPTLFAVVSADDITQRQRTPWIVRTGWSSSQPNHPFGEWVYEQGIRRVATLAYDYAFGWETVGGFQAGFENAGGQVVQKIWNPTDTKDFAPYIAQLKLDSIDAVFIQQSGGNAVRIMQQLGEFGVKDLIPIYGGGTLTDESVLKSMGEEAVGLITALHWSAALDTPQARAFVEAFRERYGYAPGYRAEAGYVAAGVVAKALEDTNGDPGGPEGLLEAIKAVRIDDAPRGPVSFDEYGGVIQNIYIRQVEMVDGELQNTVIATIPEVSQFWKWDPEEFLAHPVYSRDYPGCPNCLP